jgi:hypothetical protein
VDIVVTKAGFVEYASLAMAMPEHFDKTYNINARGVSSPRGRRCRCWQMQHQGSVLGLTRRVSAVTTNQPAMVRATQPAILRKSAFFFQTTPQQAFFTARKRPLKTSVNVRLDTSGHARMLVDLLLVQPV